MKDETTETHCYRSAASAMLMNDDVWKFKRRSEWFALSHAHEHSGDEVCEISKRKAFLRNHILLWTSKRQNAHIVRSYTIDGFTHHKLTRVSVALVINLHMNRQLIGNTECSPAREWIWIRTYTVRGWCRTDAMKVRQMPQQHKRFSASLPLSLARSFLRCGVVLIILSFIWLCAVSIASHVSWSLHGNHLVLFTWCSLNSSFQRRMVDATREMKRSLNHNHVVFVFWIPIGKKSDKHKHHHHHHRSIVLLSHRRRRPSSRKCFHSQFCYCLFHVDQQCGSGRALQTKRWGNRSRTHASENDILFLKNAYYDLYLLTKWMCDYSCDYGWPLLSLSACLSVARILTTSQSACLRVNVRLNDDEQFVFGACDKEQPTPAAATAGETVSSTDNLSCARPLNGHYCSANWS